jgi:hypothetical protein
MDLALKEKIDSYNRLLDTLIPSGRALRESLEKAGWTVIYGIQGHNGGILMISPKLASSDGWSPDIEWNAFGSLFDLLQSEGEEWGDHIVEILIGA